MLGYISVVKQKVKEGMTEENVALVKSFGIEGIRGARRREFIEIDDERTVTDPASSTIIHREAANGRCLTAVCDFIS